MSKKSTTERLAMNCVSCLSRPHFCIVVNEKILFGPRGFCVAVPQMATRGGWDQSILSAIIYLLVQFWDLIIQPWFKTLRELLYTCLHTWNKYKYTELQYPLMLNNDEVKVVQLHLIGTQQKSFRVVVYFPKRYEKYICQKWVEK